VSGHSICFETFLGFPAQASIAIIKNISREDALKEESRVKCGMGAFLLFNPDLRNLGLY
jgi:DNA polymerase III alpha subunit (gram-positive type)